MTKSAWVKKSSYKPKNETRKWRNELWKEMSGFPTANFLNIAHVFHEPNQHDVCAQKFMKLYKDALGASC